MQWEGREESTNVEDRRGLGGTAVALGGGATVVILLLSMLFGFDPQQLISVIEENAPPQTGRPSGEHRPVDPAEEKQARFAKVIFHDTETVWTKLFQNMGRQYQKPTLVLFSGQVQSACGLAGSAVGPFYCPGDERVYLDLSFFKEMQQKLNAPGDFARAYVIAHEVGHHVQSLLGYSQRAEEARRRYGKAQANQQSVRLELQADYLAGVWAHHGQEQFKFLQPGDLESALNAANEIGDDRLQKKARGYVVPDSFTHGTSRQRQKWFQAGFSTGDVDGARQLFDLPYNEL